MKLSPSATVDFYFIFAVITAIGVIVSLYTNVKNSNKNSTEGIIKANYKLDELCRSTNEIRIDQKDMNGKIDKIDRQQVKHDMTISEIQNELKEIDDRVKKLESMD